MTEAVVDGSGIRVEYDAEMDAIIMFGSLCMALATMGFVIYVHLSKEHAHSVYEDLAATGTTQLLLQDHSRATRLLESSSSIMPFRHWLAASVDRPNAVLDPRSSGEEDYGMEPDRCSCCSVCLSSYHTDDVVTVLHCGHLFHEDCVRKWISLAHVPACPLCRSHLMTTPISPTIPM
ncbi:hypothetical protein FOZ63_012352 [Perkinsus olseni]|uniref:RING-type domain-containing protein n=1 Tax=Perkinsus olseni TaxID=32597 RepID=A0A7J6UNX2_PEROL|nr:hypothetical protein FOZ63_012352 [Perkinsus olseni]